MDPATFEWNGVLWYATEVSVDAFMEPYYVRGKQFAEGCITIKGMYQCAMCGGSDALKYTLKAVATGAKLQLDVCGACCYSRGFIAPALAPAKEELPS